MPSTRPVTDLPNFGLDSCRRGSPISGGANTRARIAGTPSSSRLTSEALLAALLLPPAPLISYLALEKQAVRDRIYDDQFVEQDLFGRSNVATISPAPASSAPPAPAAAFLSTKPVPFPRRPQRKYRRSFLETFLARQQNKEATNSTSTANSSRVLSPINHIPRPTPVHPSKPDEGDHNQEFSGRATRTLLTVTEQRRSRQNSPNTPTFQDSFVPEEDNHRTSIGLPSYHRQSAQSSDAPGAPMSQEKPLPARPPVIKSPTRPNTQEQEQDIAQTTLPAKLTSNYGFAEADQPMHPPRRVNSQRSLHHVRSLTSMRSSSFSRPEAGASFPTNSPYNHVQSQPRQSPLTQPSYAQSQDRDVERGTDEQTPIDEEPAWGPSHPCYPHLNPHVPLHSPAYNSTRVIRVRRDWMILGDLAPAYSNVYPEILEPLLPESEFRHIVKHVNDTLVRTFDPFAPRNWVDGILGFLTGWFWEDLRPGGVKGDLKKLEAWIEHWNNNVGASDGVKIISLRRTGYMCLDIQIPDPQVRVVEESNGQRTPDEREPTPRPYGTATTGATR